MSNPSDANFTVKKTNFYSIDSGVKSANEDLGRTYYRLNCGNGDGFGFYENGEFIVHANKVSIERVGAGNQEKQVNDVKTFSPSKIILAEKGDIFLQALGGDVILQGNNILMNANGSEQEEGHIILTATNHIVSEGKDVSIIATQNARVAAYNNVTVGGKVTTNINGGFVSMAEQHQFDLIGSIITGGLFSPNTFLNTFNNLLNPNVF